jgi:hypothetical protein
MKPLRPSVTSHPTAIKGVWYQGLTGLRDQSVSRELADQEISQGLTEGHCCRFPCFLDWIEPI